MSSTGRVTQACARCRKQKLKCDALRPCLLCVRAGVECEARFIPPKARSDRASPARRRRSTAHTNRAGAHQTSLLSSSSSTTSIPSFPQPSASPNAQVPAACGQHQSPRGERQDAPDQSPNESQQFGANTSVIGFAKNVFRHNDLASPSITSTIPGDPGVFRRSTSRWTLHRMIMPPPTVMHTLLEAYFDRVHWFIYLFHQQSFMTRADALLSGSPWTRQDMPAIMTMLTASAMALKCILNDPEWAGHSVLATYALDARSLLADFIGEIRIHLIDLLDDSQIETVQVCILLGTYYIYHGSPSLAWSILGMAVRTAYALALHCEDPEDHPQIALQVRHRTWNHVTVADTFSAMIYGRPAGLDAEFAQVQPLSEMDDTVVTLEVTTTDEPDNLISTLSRLPFHVLKYRLYTITRRALDTFRLLRLRDPLSSEDQQALISAVSHIESLLGAWQKEVPPHLSWDDWQNVDPNGPFPAKLHDLTHVGESQTRIFYLQAMVLQVTYDSTLILIHRPLLEHKMAAGATLSSSQNFVSRSLEVAVDAALRISRVPMAKFNHHLSLSFAFMHFFTAGVILCIPPARQPFSSLAQEAKAGIMRIILTCRDLGSSSQIARHIDQLLTALLRITVLREMDNALQNQRAGVVSAEQGNAATASFNSDAPPCQVVDDRPSLNDQASLYSNQSYSTSVPSRLAASLATNLTGEGDAEFSFDLGGVHDNPGIEFDTQLDEAFGTFGQMMFNVQPDDPYTPWNWGSRSR
ncbi:hypothetical protein PV08_08197 [Exophiala spinifera]|uniref:Zn(2)-C6 fungal-type domain-containing protein n=1 Tax=Exophiala spinifera TaxID=91928 RepID=A0A0D2B356_9EURO|nr:uncharacterized protein PV08_08197 [Exophiala spinifera]KIW13010.1 hypothetical protein PV08_08197 [Exophiala spinifera]